MDSVTDFIVIGSGVAGLRAAIELSAGGWVTVLTKDRLDESNTEYAQGGVAVALSDDDEIALHAEDTLNAGAELCDEHAVRALVQEGPKYITELIEWGAEFDREKGELSFTREAAHSRRRILHAHGDSTGREIVRTLLERARRESRITFLAHAATLQLLTDENRCVGVEFIDPHENLMRTMCARAIVLATGGAGQIYSQTTNPSVATGDGMAMAFEAGAEMSDLEFVQFHPTVLSAPGAPRFLLSEALRGEGGKLRNEDGELFMNRYDSRCELAPRDVVSRSIVSEMNRTHKHWVYLDLTHLDAKFLRERFPKINLTCLRYGIDITRDPIPVSPAAHYVMGGVRTDTCGRSSVSGLYAAGEVACTGVHGANRLASNSLLEGLVFGARAGKAALQARTELTQGRGRPSVDLGPTDWVIDPQARFQVQDLMWQRVGVVRDGNGLRNAVDALGELLEGTANRRTRSFAMLAQLMTRSALWREESRGAHFRTDFPERDDISWRVHSVIDKRGNITGVHHLSEF